MPPPKGTTDPPAIAWRALLSTLLIGLILAVADLLIPALSIVGLAMAAPLTAAVMLLVQMLYSQDGLGDPSPGRFAGSD